MFRTSSSALVSILVLNGSTETEYDQNEIAINLSCHNELLLWPILPCFRRPKAPMTADAIAMLNNVQKLA